MSTRVIEPEETASTSETLDPADPSNSNNTTATEWFDIGSLVFKLKCKFCTFETGDQHTLRAHNEQVHVPAVPEKTPNPNTTSESVAESSSDNLPDTVLQHKIEAEVGEQSPSSQIYLCSECNIAFSSEEQCFEHMSTEHGLDEFTTDNIVIVNEIKPPVLAKSNLPTRRKSKPPKYLTLEGGGVVVPMKYRKEPRIKCKLCEVKYEQEEVLQIHEQCHIKNFMSQNREKLAVSTESDAEIQNSLKGYACILCFMQREQSTSAATTISQLKTFSRWGKCSSHLWQKHQIDCDLYQCDRCEFKTYTKFKLVDHQNVHGIPSKFKCETCHKSFKQLCQLKNHEKYHKEKLTKLPPPGEDRWYTPKECPICKRVLSDQKCLKRHISYVHNKLKQNVCNVCGHMTARRAELQLHMRQHTGEKPHKCTFCSFTTRDHNSLRKHKIRHTKDNMYSCPHCEYKCIQTHAFKKHLINFHPDQESVLQCPLCSFITINMTLFETHKKGHNHNDVRIRIGEQIETEIVDESNSSSTNDADLNVEEATKATEEDTGRQISVRTQSWLREEEDSSDSGDIESAEVENIGGTTIPNEDLE